MSTTTPTKYRHVVLETKEIPVGLIIPNPRNPRPFFMLSDNDPSLKNMADSMRITGQHETAAVYEIRNHYDLGDMPGTYMLLKGERRWRTTQIAGLETLRCDVFATPEDLAHELELLGQETAFKEDWGKFYTMKFAWELSQTLQLPVTHHEIIARTGLKVYDLQQADKVFRLEPTIQSLAAAYEEEMYLQRVNGDRKSSGRLVGSGVRTKEFTFAKAAVVYEIFIALRERFPTLVKDYDDEELQRRLSIKVTQQQASYRQLEALLSMIRSYKMESGNVPRGLITEISEIVSTTKTVGSALKSTSHSDAQLFNKSIASMVALERRMAKFSKGVNQIGQDLPMLIESRTHLLQMLRTLNDIERAVDKHIQMTKANNNDR